jgi:predicted transposase YbfD/YdcC
MPRNPNKIDYSRGFPESFEAFEELTDTRKDGYTTFSRIMESLDPVLFSQCIITHLRLAGVEVEDDQIAIDGKALRGSRTKEERHIHAVSAWACEKGITLAQSFVDEKSNEITAIPELLKMLNLQGAVVTIDAMGTQRGIASQIIAAGADYVLYVKGNQGGLHKEIIDQFDFAARQLDTTKRSSKNWSLYLEEEKNRGRLERRQTIVCHNIDWMTPKTRDHWKALASIILVQLQALEKDGNWRTEIHYDMSSLKKVKAKKMQKYIRSHWRIENSCHCVLDTL